eukprot:Clim_evm8s239 gene=Clim_evmTU8s239
MVSVDPSTPAQVGGPIRRRNQPPSPYDYVKNALSSASKYVSNYIAEYIGWPRDECTSPTGVGPSSGDEEDGDIFRTPPNATTSYAGQLDGVHIDLGSGTRAKAALKAPVGTSTSSFRASVRLGSGNSKSAIRTPRTQWKMLYIGERSAATEGASSTLQIPSSAQSFDRRSMGGYSTAATAGSVSGYAVPQNARSDSENFNPTYGRSSFTPATLSSPLAQMESARTPVGHSAATNRSSTKPSTLAGNRFRGTRTGLEPNRMNTPGKFLPSTIQTASPSSAKSPSASLMTSGRTLAISSRRNMLSPSNAARDTLRRPGSGVKRGPRAVEEDDQQLASPSKRHATTFNEPRPQLTEKAQRLMSLISTSPSETGFAAVNALSTTSSRSNIGLSYTPGRVPLGGTPGRSAGPAASLAVGRSPGAASLLPLTQRIDAQVQSVRQAQRERMRRSRYRVQPIYSRPPAKKASSEEDQQLQNLKKSAPYISTPMQQNKSEPRKEPANVPVSPAAKSSSSFGMAMGGGGKGNDLAKKALLNSARHAQASLQENTMSPMSSGGALSFPTHPASKSVGASNVDGQSKTKRTESMSDVSFSKPSEERLEPPKEAGSLGAGLTSSQKVSHELSKEPAPGAGFFPVMNPAEGTDATLITNDVSLPVYDLNKAPLLSSTATISLPGSATSTTTFKFGPRTAVESKPVTESKPSASITNPLAKFTPPSGSWSCQACMVTNKPEDGKCVSCMTPKPSVDGAKGKMEVPAGRTPAPHPTGSSLLDKFRAKAGSWKCDTCMTSNDADRDKCIACETSKSGTKFATSTPAPPVSNQSSGFTFGTSLAPGRSPEALKTVADPDAHVGSSLLDKFKAKPGTWKCDACMTSNDGDRNKCIACESPNPGAKSATSSASTAPALTFGKAGGFTFGMPKTVSVIDGSRVAANAPAGAEEKAPEPVVSSGGFRFGVKRPANREDEKREASPAPAGGSYSFDGSKPATTEEPPEKRATISKHTPLAFGKAPTSVGAPIPEVKAKDDTPKAQLFGSRGVTATPPAFGGFGKSNSVSTVDSDDVAPKPSPLFGGAAPAISSVDAPQPATSGGFGSNKTDYGGGFGSGPANGSDGATSLSSKSGPGLTFGAGASAPAAPVSTKNSSFGGGGFGTGSAMVANGGSSKPLFGSGSAETGDGLKPSPLASGFGGAGATASAFGGATAPPKPVATPQSSSGFNFSAGGGGAAPPFGGSATPTSAFGSNSAAGTGAPAPAFDFGAAASSASMGFNFGGSSEAPGGEMTFSAGGATTQSSGRKKLRAVRHRR